MKKLFRKDDGSLSLLGLIVFIALFALMIALGGVNPYAEAGEGAAAIVLLLWVFSAEVYAGLLGVLYSLRHWRK